MFLVFIPKRTDNEGWNELQRKLKSFDNTDHNERYTLLVQLLHSYCTVCYTYSYNLPSDTCCPKAGAVWGDS